LNADGKIRTFPFSLPLWFISVLTKTKLNTEENNTCSISEEEVLFSKRGAKQTILTQPYTHHFQLNRQFWPKNEDASSRYKERVSHQRWRCYNRHLVSAIQISQSIIRSIIYLSDQCYWFGKVILCVWKRGRDVGFLPDLASSNNGNGAFHVEVFRWSRCSSIRAFHRWIYLVLFSFHHHSCPCWYLGGNVSFPIPCFSLLFLIISH
jgi:hypothetical protein